MLLTDADVLSGKPIQKKRETNTIEVEKTFLVFLVDDDRFFLNSLSYFLSDSLPPEFNIMTFTTAADCLKAMELQPDIVLLDYFLSADPLETRNGLAVIKEIKLRSPDCHVVVLSAQDNPEVISGMFEEGAYDYVTKNGTAHQKVLEIIKITSQWFPTQEEMEITTSRNITLVLLLLIGLISVAMRSY